MDPRRRQLSIGYRIRFCFVLLVPLATVIIGRQILTKNIIPIAIGFNGSNSRLDNSFMLTSSQLIDRIKRNPSNVINSHHSSLENGSQPTVSVSLFGVSLEYEDDPKSVQFSQGFASILEYSVVNLRLFGIFANGTKLKLAKNGFSCDADYVATEEFDIRLEQPSHKSSLPVKQSFNFTYGRVEDVTIPKRNDFPKVYFCLWDPINTTWEPQGTSKARYFEITSKFLPVWTEAILIILLLCFSGLFSGLNLGLMSLDKTDLKIIINTGTPKEREYASKISPVRNHGNFLLCCLLFSNVLVNATLTILMDGLTSGAIAIVFSTLTIVIFGEIIPQAICSRYGLAVGAKTIYVTKLFMGLTFPLSYPLSLILDKLLGEEIGSVYTRERLKELLKVTKDHHGLENEEVALISGALDMKTKTVKDVMTKLENVFMLPLDVNLDYETISEIEFQGYTRIPVYDKVRNNVVAVLNVKQLTLLDASDSIPIRTVVEYYQTTLFYVFENTRLDYMFRVFREGNRGHMAFVQKVNDDGPGDPFYETVGVVTMEDVLEELLQADILDETDVGKFRARMENRAQTVPFLSKKRSTMAISVPPPLALAACQYLVTAVPAFNRDTISEGILNRLVLSTVSLLKPPKYADDDTSKLAFLYERGKVSSIFIMILEGKVEVQVGKENLVFQAGPFHCFGSEFLLTKPAGYENNKNMEALSFDSPLIEKHGFVPDYSVRVTTETFYMKVRYSVYCAAKAATELEKRYNSDPKAALTNENWRKEVDDILTSVDVDIYKRNRRMVYSECRDDEPNAENETHGTKSLSLTSDPADHLVSNHDIARAVKSEPIAGGSKTKNFKTSTTTVQLPSNSEDPYPNV